MGFVFEKDNSDKYIINTNTGEALLYVHRNYENFESSAATQYFQTKQALGEKMLARYKSSLLQSMTIPPKVSDILELADNKNLENFFKQIDQGLSQGLESSLADMPTQLNNYSAKARQVYNPQKIETFDKVLDIINSALKLVFGNKNELSVLLNSNKGIPSTSLKQILQDALNRNNGKIIGFNSITLNKVAKDLVNMISRIEGEGLSKKSFSSYISDIFSTGLGEYLIAKGIQKQISKATKKSVETLLAGTKTPGLDIKNAQKYDSEEFLVNATYKPDVVAQNFQIQINENGDTISVNLGLSVKQYSSNSSSVSIVTNKPFQQVLGALFNDGKYYAYNTLGLLSDSNAQYREMKKSIILAYADNFLSGSGVGNDFAQYIIVNGQPYPIYDILKKVISDTTGASTTDNDASDPVKISIAGASDLVKLRSAYPGPNSWDLAWERARAVNSIISGDLTVHGTLNLSALRP